MAHEFLAKRVSKLEESATLALNARVKQMARSGETVYNLTAGELDSSTPEYIQKAVAATLDRNKYTPVAGLPELRTAIAAHSRSFYKVETIEPSNVVVTGGAKPALAATFLAVLNPGDEVILPTPAWVSYQHLIELAGGKVVNVPLNESWNLDVAAVEAAITPRTKLILINSPQNPTGVVFTHDSLMALSEVLKEKDILVLADDIYSKLIFDPGYSPITECGFNTEHLIIVNGFSKSQALTGWRVGYVVANITIADAIIKLLSHITGNASLPGQHAALAALARNDAPEMLDSLKERRQLVAKELAQIPNISAIIPGGAFYFFLDLRSISTDSAKWCEQLLSAKHVALVPGEAFNAPGFARLSFAASATTLTTSIRLIRDFAKGEKL